MERSTRGAIETHASAASEARHILPCCKTTRLQGPVHGCAYLCPVISIVIQRGCATKAYHYHILLAFHKDVQQLHYVVVNYSSSILHLNKILACLRYTSNKIAETAMVCRTTT